MSSLTESQKARFFEDQEYSEITASLQQMVQVELLNLVKAKIESNSLLRYSSSARMYL